MEPVILLAQLRALFERAPDFEDYSPTSRDHMMWLGQAHALVSRWDRLESISFKVASDSLPNRLLLDSHVATIFGILSRAISDIELNIPDKEQVVFAAGQVYDFFRELNKVVESAESSLFIVDPYLDHTVFDHYLNSRQPEVTVRLLLNRNADNVKAAAEKYKTYGDKIQLEIVGRLPRPF